MQTVSFAGSSYNIPTVRGDRPWDGLSDFVIAAASKAINTAGGNFTLLANINFGATFGLVSAFYTSRTASAADAGAFRLASTDVINWRNNAAGGNVSLSKDTSDVLKWNSTKILLSGAVVNADIQAAAAIAVNKLAALTASRATVTDASGFLASATTTAIEIGYVNGVTSAIQTQINTKSSAASPTFTGTVTLPVTADRALQTGTSSVLEASATTKTELGYVSGVTSAIQTQLTAKAADSAVVHNTGTENVAGAKTFTTQLIGKGTAAADDAAAGYIGEFARTYVAPDGPALTTGQYQDATSVSLTAGDWDVTGIFEIDGQAATVFASVRYGISTTSGNSATGLAFNDNLVTGAIPNFTNDLGTGVVAGWRLSLSGTTTVYLKVKGIFSGGTATCAGRISARRVR